VLGAGQSRPVIGAVLLHGSRAHSPPDLRENSRELLLKRERPLRLQGRRVLRDRDSKPCASSAAIRAVEPYLASLI
jgi:hypothetical protein